MPQIALSGGLYLPLGLKLPVLGFSGILASENDTSMSRRFFPLGVGDLMSCMSSGLLA